MTEPTKTATQRADEFAVALGDLCKRHGVMLWTAFDTTPMMISVAPPGDGFHYESVECEGGLHFEIKRSLS